MEEALAPHLGAIHGVDISEEMLLRARRRCAGLRNVALSACTGRDLDAFAAESFDLVLAVDSFPYLVQSGHALVDAHVAGASRVLRAGSDLVVLNYSYRDDPSADREDVRVLARKHGFEVLVCGATPFAIWSAPAFRLRRRA